MESLSSDDDTEILTETNNVFDAADEISDGLSIGDILDIPVYVFGEQVGSYRINASRLKEDFTNHLFLKRRFED